MDYTDKPVVSSQALLLNRASYNTQLKSISGPWLSCCRYRALLFCTGSLWRPGETLAARIIAIPGRPVTALGVGPDFCDRVNLTRA